MGIGPLRRRKRLRQANLQGFQGCNPSGVSLLQGVAGPRVRRLTPLRGGLVGDSVKRFVGLMQVHHFRPRFRSSGQYLVEQLGHGATCMLGHGFAHQGARHHDAVLDFHLRQGPRPG